MDTCQMPENVGKKIVEALKRRAGLSVKQEPAEETLEENVSESFDEVITNEESYETGDEPQDVRAFDDEYVSDETIEGGYDGDEYVQPEEADNQTFEEVQETYDENEASDNETDEYEFTDQNIQPEQDEVVSEEEITDVPVNDYEIENRDYEYSSPNYVSSSDLNMPTNVAILSKLIKQLPSGVSKQAGAQIIRQTMEALGISLTNVLKEAQEVQDKLSTDIRDCNSKIDEYKRYIIELEQNVRDFKSQTAQLDSLISLFVLTKE